MICQYCHAPIKKEQQPCEFCGNIPAISYIDAVTRKRVFDKDNPLAVYYVMAIAFIPFIIAYVVFGIIFNDDLDRMINSFTILILLAAVLAIIFGAVMQIRHHLKLKASGVKVVAGEVVDVHVFHGIRDRFYPIIEYEVNGKKHRYVYPYDSNTEPKVGKAINIAYHVHNPRNCFLANDLRGLTIVISTVVAIGVIGAFSLYFSAMINGNI